MSALDELYREIILDHYKNPRNRGRLPDPDIATQGNNPLCGDEVEVSLTVRDGRVVGVAFEGRGCSISQASASMLTEGIKGKTVAEATELAEAFKQMMTGDSEPDPDVLGDVEALAGVRKYPVRVKCATLAWNTLLEGLELLQKAKGSTSA